MVRNISKPSPSMPGGRRVEGATRRTRGGGNARPLDRVTLPGLELSPILGDRGTAKTNLTLEILDGFIVKKVRGATGGNPHVISDHHSLVVNRLTRLASKFEPHGSYLQIQQPVRLPPWNEPEPDASVIRGDPDAATGKPVAADVLCVIEVADSSLARDLGTKRRAYAEAGIAQYVVVDLVHNVVLVHSDSAASA